MIVFSSVSELYACGSHTLATWNKWQQWLYKYVLYKCLVGTFD